MGMIVQGHDMRIGMVHWGSTEEMGALLCEWESWVGDLLHGNPLCYFMPLFFDT
jgi:hypothetical protein